MPNILTIRANSRLCGTSLSNSDHDETRPSVHEMNGTTCRLVLCTRQRKGIAARWPPPTIVWPDKTMNHSRYLTLRGVKGARNPFSDSDALVAPLTADVVSCPEETLFSLLTTTAPY